MKKGLLSILAGALLVVGCQNYDDQFSNIESQITSLAKQVEGLSQVQDDLTDLGNQVTSLQSSIGTEVDAALADGLANIDTAVATLNAATENAASSADVQAIADAVAANASDLTELLESAAIFQGDVIINSTATLDVYEKMGSSINIVNGYVDITVTADMDIAKVQKVVDNIFTTVKYLTYTSPTSDIAEVTFTKLTGTQTLTVTQAGGYDFRNLTNATAITLGDAFKSTIRVIHFGAMLNAKSFTTGTTTHTIAFNKATELHLTSLKRFDTTSVNPLTLEVDEGSVIALTALDDIGTDGLQEDIFLNITGPASFESSKFTDGALTFKDVKTVTINDFSGTITTNAGVENFTANKLVDTYTVGADIEVLNVTGALDADNTSDQSGPAITSTTNDNLESATIGGNVASISLASAKLATVVITADVAGAISLADSDDLVTVTLTGSKATGVTIDDCDELASLTVDTAIQKGRSTTAVKTAALKLNGSVVVTDNTELTTLTISSSDLAVLTITGNTDLETIEGSGILTIGATAASNIVKIYSNNLIATKSTDKVNTASTLTADGQKNDLGKFVSVSGMDTLKTYLDLVALNTSAEALVYYDTIESLIDTAGAETTDKTYAANPTLVYVLNKTAGSGDGTAAGTAIAVKRAFIIDLSTGDGTKAIGAYLGVNAATSVNLFATGTDATTGVSEVIETNASFMLTSLRNAANVGRWAALANITLESSYVARSSLTVSLMLHKSAAQSIDFTLVERYVAGDAAGIVNVGTGFTAVSTATNYGFGGDDEITLTVGANTVTASSTGAARTLTQIGAALVTAWGAKYGNSGTASGSAIATIVSSGGSITITMLDKGTAGAAQPVSVSVAAGTVTATNAKNLDWKIGATNVSSDNATVPLDVLLTMEHNGIGADTTATVSFTATNLVALPVEIFTTRTTNSVPATGEYALAQESADPRLAEGASAAIAATTAASSLNRVGWL